jgi:hypothetical protein
MGRVPLIREVVHPEMMGRRAVFRIGLKSVLEVVKSGQDGEDVATPALVRGLEPGCISAS